MSTLHIQLGRRTRTLKIRRRRQPEVLHGRTPAEDEAEPVTRSLRCIQRGFIKGGFVAEELIVAVLEDHEGTTPQLDGED